MIRRAVILLVLAALGGVAGWWVGQWALPGQPARVAASFATSGEPVPDMRWPRLDGTGEIALAALRGRPILLNFWASWCGPCIHEMPLLDAYAREQADHGVQVIGIALDSEDDVRAFLAKMPVTYPNAVEPPSREDSSNRLGNKADVLPYSVLIDADGRMIAAKSGSFQAPELRAWASQASP